MSGSPSFRELLLSRRMLICLLTGFSSGMPLYVLTQLVPAWLETEGVDLEDIGLMALVGLPYTWKFLWSPLVDRYVPPFLGRRRGWALIFQLLLTASIATIGWLEPDRGLQPIVAMCLAVAFFSASQDIVLDAYRRELLPDRELGLGNSLFINAYRASGLIPGSLGLILADQLEWNAVFGVTACFMAVGVLGTALAPVVATDVVPPRTLREAVVQPLREIFLRGDAAVALRLVAFLLLYKLGDAMATALIIPFYQQVGFTMTQIGAIAKVVGLWAAVIGAFAGGAAITRIGINRALWVFGLVQMLSILGFAALHQAGPDPRALAVVVGLEYLGVGLGASAMLAFMARETDRRFSATQFALFSSIVALPRTVMAATTGYLTVALGWTGFFLFCTLMAVPGMLMLPWVAPWNEPDDPTPSPTPKDG